MKLSVFIATSLDGMIARSNDEIDWLPQGDNEDGEDFGYQDFFNSIDGLLMGRRSFEKLLTFNEWHYGDKPVYILSNTITEIPVRMPESVKLLTGTFECALEYLKLQGHQHIYIDGGQMIQTALRQNLIHQMIITLIPVLIGKGISLFGNLEHDVHFELQACRSFSNGLAQLHYIRKQ